MIASTVLNSEPYFWLVPLLIGAIIIFLSYDPDVYK
jgi:hypothetical protein